MKKESVSKLKKMWEDGRCENFYHLLELAYDDGAADAAANQQTLLDEVNRLNGVIEERENAHRKKAAGFLILMKGGKICKSCNGNQYRMNRNGYSENCFTCNGTGAVFN